MPVYTVKGSHASSNEYFVSLALEKLHIDYTFQYAPHGRRGRRGEFYVDFLLYLPRPTPLEVFGEHWHTGQLGADDQLRLEMIENIFGVPAKVLWGMETDTREKALESVRKAVGNVV